jgi:hypothetical protein
MYRWGTHETQTQDIETYLDGSMGNSKSSIVFEESKPIYPTYEDWQAISGETIEPDSFPEKSQNGLLLDAKAQKITTPQQWRKKPMRFGNASNGLRRSPLFGRAFHRRLRFGYDYLAAMFARSGETKGVKKQKFVLGITMPETFIYPEGSEKSETRFRRSFVAFPQQCRRYIPNYRRGPLPHLRLVEAGFPC